jgi:hypothetical protein
MEDSGRDQVKDEFLSVHDNGMPGVVPPLIANHPVRIPGETIRQFTFSFVSPLRSDHCGRLFHDYSGSDGKKYFSIKAR